MGQEAKSPLDKLSLLHESFVLIAQLVESCSGEPPNADVLLPVICELIVQARYVLSIVYLVYFISHVKLCSSPSHLAANLAFIHVMTSGGGTGEYGYTLTTFWAAMHVLLSIEFTTSQIEEDEFYDAIGNID